MDRAQTDEHLLVHLEQVAQELVVLRLEVVKRDAAQHHARVHGAAAPTTERYGVSN